MVFPRLTDEERERKMNIPAGKIRLIIDSDAKNEVDDQFAISWAIRSPERFRLEAVYAAPFVSDVGLTRSEDPESSYTVSGVTYTDRPGNGMEASYQEILKLFGLLGKDPEGCVFRGSEEFISRTGKPVESEAAGDLIRRAMSGDETVYVAAIGAPTNIASALLLEPELVRKIVVIWLGGQPLYYKHGIEFNLMQDAAASRVLFDSGVPLIMIPCMNTASLLTLSKPEVETYLKGRGAICDYLADIVLDTFGDENDNGKNTAAMRRANMYLREDRPETYLSQFPLSKKAWSRVIWDVSAIAFLKNPAWTPSLPEHSPILNNDLSWGAEDSGRHMIRVVNYCYRDLIFGDMIKCLQN